MSIPFTEIVKNHPSFVENPVPFGLLIHHGITQHALTRDRLNLLIRRSVDLTVVPVCDFTAFISLWQCSNVLIIEQNIAFSWWLMHRFPVHLGSYVYELYAIL